MSKPPLFVKPVVAGAVIRDPNTTRTLPPDGDEVPDVPFWRRRIAAGEVVLATRERHTSAVIGAPSEAQIPPLTIR